MNKAPAPGLSLSVDSGNADTLNGLRGEGKKKAGRPKGKSTRPRKATGYKAKNTDGSYTHPLYRAKYYKIKTIGTRTRPRQVLPGPKCKRYGYQFEYKHSTRLIYVRNAKGSITREQHAHHARAAAPYVRPIVEGYLLTWAILPGYCLSTGIPLNYLQALILIKAYQDATGRRSFTAQELGTYLRWEDPRILADNLRALENDGYIMIIAPAVERSHVIRSIRSGESSARRFATTTHATDILLTLWDYLEQIREQWNTEISPITYTEHPPAPPKI